MRILQYKDVHSFHNSQPWRRLRDAMLQLHPLCIDCLKEGKIEASTEVHHIKPVETHPHLALEPSNLVCLCKAHHSYYTQIETTTKKDGIILNKKWKI